MYRTIDTAAWDDPWVAELEPLDKLLFFYLMTNRRTTACGVFEITVKAIAFETGMSQNQIKAGLQRLHPKVVWWPHHQAVWVVNFYRHQSSNGNPVTFTKSAAAKLLAFDPEIVQAVCAHYPALTPECGLPTLLDAEPTHTLPTPYPSSTLTSKETVTVTGTETATKAEPEGAREIKIDFDAFFEDVWRKYPTREGAGKIGKTETRAVVFALGPAMWPDVRKAVVNYAASGRMPVDPIRFFKSKEYPAGLWRQFVTKEKTSETTNGIGPAGGSTEKAPVYTADGRRLLDHREAMAQLTRPKSA